MPKFAVTVHGPAFGEGLDKTIEGAILGEALDKINQRLMRKRRKGLGARRNTLSLSERGALEFEVDTTLKNPRNTGKAWNRKQLAIARAMAPRVLRSTAKRIVGDLN